MKTTLSIVLILVVGVGAVASLIPIGEVNAAPGAPGVANGEGSSHSDPNAHNQGTNNAIFRGTPFNQPCSVLCR
jgi:hypothetical protein